MDSLVEKIEEQVEEMLKKLGPFRGFVESALEGVEVKFTPAQVHEYIARLNELDEVGAALSDLANTGRMAIAPDNSASVREILLLLRKAENLADQVEDVFTSVDEDD